METNAIQQQVNNSTAQLISPEALLNHWQGHRKLTRKVIEAFPEDKLFNYSVGGMRSFGVMVIEIMDIAHYGIDGIITGKWNALLDHSSGNIPTQPKAEILKQWDEITAQINEYWPQISVERFLEVELAFGAYENQNIGTILYAIDNEIHHRAQAYVYLRTLGIEPPAFWDRY
ncbi:Uncharacterized damage-inducible protein DinB (forms a four-helix bundle) [Mucilaginibacter sp. OK268]|uniref:DinB family protein n=1 Tax=Mucilaginibacter sp. OK268 TaxID=1881048 RepID=UPI000881F5BB|nr:DinB family protein [Mucilaginibacter sp. OK268]SDP91504.1 Uncharacterized damage-inducible protein DinB (forms a four-helix bundle) [Mucilaginibacter sp. OK268]